jgi:integrase
MASIHEVKSAKTGKVVSYRVRWRSPDSKLRSRSFARKLDARRWAVKIDDELKAGTYVSPSAGKVTVAEVAEKVARKKINVRASTRARDEAVLRSLVLPHFGDWQVRSVTVDDVQAWVTELSQVKAATTVRKAYQLLGQVFAHAVGRNLIVNSPCVGVALPRLEDPPRTFLDRDQVRDLADAIDPRFRVFVYTAALTGLRFGELAALHVDDLDLDNGTLTVTKTQAEVRGEVSVTSPKTKASRRTVSLPGILSDALRWHLTRFSIEDGRVFPAAEGGPLRASNFRRRYWTPAVKRAGLDGLRIHDLRHTHAALLIEQGEHAKVIQSRLGHRSIKTTMDTYGHLFEGLDRDAADRLDEAFGGDFVPSVFPQAAGEVIPLHP